jgi:HEAT repeat protein
MPKHIKSKNSSLANRGLLIQLGKISLVREDDHRWRLLRQHLKNTRLDVLMAALRTLAIGERPSERRLAADMLGQVPGMQRRYRTGCAEVLLKMSEDEKSLIVLEALGAAFGHVEDNRAVPFLLQLSRNKSLVIRRAATFGLTGIESNSATSGLIRLSRDRDVDVRSWATFGIGTLSDHDSNAVRRALVARLNDEDAEVRSEAILGLARRQDARARAALEREFKRGYYGSPLLDATCEFPSSSFLPHLHKIADHMKRKKANLSPALTAAIQACSDCDRNLRRRR